MITRQIYDEHHEKLILWLTEGRGFYPNYMKGFYLSEERARDIIDRVWLALTEEDKENERYDHLIHATYLLAEGYNKETKIEIVRPKIEFVETLNYINVCKCGEKVTMLYFREINYEGKEGGWETHLGICSQCPTIFFTLPIFRKEPNA